MKIYYILAFLLVSTLSMAQIKTPSASTTSKVEQTVGLTTVNLQYSRPGVKGRTIFAADGLVPHGKIWRTGANQATKITFSDDVTINGKDLKAGAYAVLTKPMANEWTFHFYTHESNSWSSYVDKEPDLITTSKVEAMPFKMETFTISIQDVKTESASIEFLWASTMVALDLGVNVDERVMSNIDQVLGGPTPGDYYNAANYYHSSGKDLNKALEWVSKATDVAEPRFWQVRRKALILADLGRKKEAIEVAKKSLMLAEKAGNDDYIKMNNDSIAEWSK